MSSPEETFPGFEGMDCRTPQFADPPCGPLINPTVPSTASKTFDRLDLVPPPLEICPTTETAHQKCMI